jgi:ribonuclease HI
VVYKILGAHNKITSSPKYISTKTCIVAQIDGYTLACFDGASISGGRMCGARGVIKHPGSTVHRWFLNCRNGTNTKAELMGVWDTLILAKQWYIQKIQILGHSKVVFDWLNHRGKL